MLWTETLELREKNVPSTDPASRDLVAHLTGVDTPYLYVTAEEALEEARTLLWLRFMTAPKALLTKARCSFVVSSMGQSLSVARSR